MEYFDIDVYSRPITTEAADAALWFNRGLTWCYAFGHEEAVRCFERALEHDPDFAMAYWGIAYAAGPNYNMPWEVFDEQSRRESLARAHEAAGHALARAGKVSPQEAALIGAIQARYPQAEPIDDMTPWDDAYADAMRNAWRQFPADHDLRALFVDAIMNRTPWKLWDIQSGETADGADTLEARAVLEEAFETSPEAKDHPGLLHLYVHLMEMSPFPERAFQAGDRLRELVPDAGHLVHMPTHIDVLCGNYHDVLYWNEKAIAADRKYAAVHGPLNIYTAYRLHNYHFAVYGAMFLGRYDAALAYAEEMIREIPEELLRIESPPMADFMESFASMKQHVLIRFGKWQEIIAQDMPGDAGLYSNLTATMHYAKGVAHAALGEVPEAEREQQRFREATRKVPESRLLHNNKCVDLLEIAEEMLAGEIEYRKANYDAAFAHLRRSVEIDDALPYDEPWGWMQPTRHALGALLLEQGRIAEAEAVYREDLGLGGKLSRVAVHPDNIWSLRGLHECLIRRNEGDTPETRMIGQRLDIASARADIPVEVSCFCAGSSAA